MKKIFNSLICISLSLMLVFQSVIKVEASEINDFESIDQLEEMPNDSSLSIKSDLILDNEYSNQEEFEIKHDDNQLSTVSDLEMVESSSEVIEDDYKEIQVNDLPSEEYLFVKYANNMFGADYFETSDDRPLLRGTTSYKYLNNIERDIYDALEEFADEVANGERSNTTVTIGAEDELFGGSYIEIEDLYDCRYDEETKKWNVSLNSQKVEQGKQDISNQFAYDLPKILRALSFDRPELLYWYGRSYSYRTVYARGMLDNSVSSIKKTSETSTEGTLDGYLKIDNMVITMFVSNSYAEYDVESGSYNTSKADITKTGATKAAIENANEIARTYSNLNDYEKLLSFKEKICSLVTYNTEAAASGSLKEMGSNPWELIYVFDNDNTTNVVCEGYAKAFQYLCDLSEFQNDVNVICVNGTMNGEGHRWNIVDFNGSNFLVDVTNCDNIPDFPFGHKGLFMKGYKSGNVTSGYVITRNRIDLDTGGYYPEHEINYTYYPEIISLYNDNLSVITLNNYDFDPNSSAFGGVIITKQPEGAKCSGYGKYISMSVEASGEGLGYDWQYQWADGTIWQSFVNGNGKPGINVLMSGAKYEGIKIRCVVSSKDGGSTTSETAVLGFAKGPEITRQPESAKCSGYGKYITVSVEASGEGLGYDWQYQWADGTTWQSFVNGNGKSGINVLMSGAKYDGIKIRCVVSSKDGGSTTSETAVLGFIQ